MVQEVEVLLALEVLPLNLALEVLPLNLALNLLQEEHEEQMALEEVVFQSLNLALMEVVAQMEFLQSLNWSLTEMLQMRLVAVFPSS